MSRLAKWAERGQTFTINADGTLQPGRRWASPQEAAEAKAEREAIKAELLGRWETVLIVAAGAWAVENGYEAVIRWGNQKITVQPNIDHCAHPGHEDRPQYLGLAVCDECALFARRQPAVVDFATGQALHPAEAPPAKRKTD